MYYQSRYYDPNIARFISADTIIPDSENSQSYNRYTYTFNNPVVYKDSSGHYPEWYTARTGMRAHDLFFDWVQRTYPDWSQDMEFDETLKESLNIFSNRRPDVIDTQSRKLWELKPISYMTSSKKTEQGVEQLENYVEIIRAKTGEIYRRANPEDLVPYQKGGIDIGEVEGFLDRQYRVKVYPNQQYSGLIHYVLEPVEKDVIRQAMKYLRNSFAPHNDNDTLRMRPEMGVVPP